MSYTLTAGSSIVRDADGATIPADTANSDYRDYLAWRGTGGVPTPYTPPPVLRQIPTSDFVARFTLTEQAAVWAACAANAPLGAGLTTGLANGYINLDGPTVTAWLQGLVAAGAITNDRSIEVAK